jgi:hypothetical protein
MSPAFQSGERDYIYTPKSRRDDARFREEAAPPTLICPKQSPHRYNSIDP